MFWTAEWTWIGCFVANPFGMSYIGQDIQMAVADLDGDGDYDALLGEMSGSFYYYENTGTAIAPAFAAPVMNPFNLTNIARNESTPEFGDLDGDGDLDLIVGALNADILYFENTGTTIAPAFAAMQANPFGLSVDSTFFLLQVWQIWIMMAT